MQITSATELGDRMRDQRASGGMSQQALADAIGVSRHWVIKIERGNAAAETGLVLKALHVLGLVLDLRPATAPPASDEPAQAIPDLAEILDRVRGRRSDVR